MRPRRPTTPDWRRLAAALAGLGACALAGWIAFGRGHRIPLLGGVDLGFHELGHLVTYLVPTPQMVSAIMGSVFQVAIPLGLAAYFWFRRREIVPSALMLAWAGTSARDVSVYVADAPFQRLPLIGGEHDWAFLLGPDGWDALPAAGTVATVVKAAGAAAVYAALALCIYAAVEALGYLDPQRIEVPGSGRRIRPARFRPADGADPFPHSRSTPGGLT